MLTTEAGKKNPFYTVSLYMASFSCINLNVKTEVMYFVSLNATI
jgi:hypothetical protein